MRIWQLSHLKYGEVDA